MNRNSVTSSLSPRTSCKGLLHVAFCLLIAWGAVGTATVTPAVAQNLNGLDQFVEMETAYRQLKAKGDWSGAGRLAQRMVEFSKRQRMARPLQLAALDYVALAELNLGNYQESLKLFEQLVEQTKQLPAVDPTFRVSVQLVTYNGLIGVGRSHRLLGDNVKSAEAFHAAINYAKRVGQHGLAASAGSDLGYLYLAMGDDAAAIAEFEGCLRVLRQEAIKRDALVATKNNYANAMQGLAIGYMNEGRYSEAEPYARAAIDWTEAALGPMHAYRAQALKTLAMIYSYQNRFEAAIELYEEGVAIFAKHTGVDHPMCLGIKNNLSRMYAVVGRADEAVKMAREVVAARREHSGQESASTITAMINLANVYYQLERHEEASKEIEPAVLLCNNHLTPNHRETLEALRLSSSIDIELGVDSKKILQRLNRVLAIYESRSTNPGELAEAYISRALVREKSGQREKAIEDMEQALKQAELQRALASGGGRERAKLFTDFTRFFGQTMVWHAEEEKDGLPAAFEIAERMKARSFVDALHTADFDSLQGLPAVLRQRYQTAEKQARDAVTKAEQAYDALPSKTDNETDQDRRRRQQAAAAVYVARNQLYDHLVTVQNSNPTYRELITNRSEPAKLSDVQSKLLAKDELLLSYAAFDERMFVFSVSKDSVAFTELLIGKEQAKALGVEPGELGEKDLAKIFLGKKGLLEALSRPRKSAPVEPKLAALWNLLIPAADKKKLLDGSVKLLTVLPDGLLALLPMETLIVEQTDAGPVYLLDAGPPVAYAPSASVLMNLAKRAPHQAIKGREPILTLGDPSYTQPSGGSSRAATVRAKLSRLPFSGNESEWVAQHFGKHGETSVKLNRSQATEANLRRLISGREIVHLACHGMAEDLYGNFFGCLALAVGKQGDANDDGFLYTPEIYKLDLRGCELAILSACETNFGPQQTGEGVWTISRGFLVSGARRVLASNWVVDDEAGATLVSYFAYNLADTPAADASSAESKSAETSASRRSYAAALQKAKQSLRKQEKWSGPFYWSGLVLVGPK